MAFFQTNPAYQGCTNIGTDFLSNKLSMQLIRSIQQQLPVITSSIDNGCAPAIMLIPQAGFCASWCMSVPVHVCPFGRSLDILACRGCVHVLLLATS